MSRGNEEREFLGRDGNEKGDAEDCGIFPLSSLEDGMRSDEDCSLLRRSETEASNQTKVLIHYAILKELTTHDHRFPSSHRRYACLIQSNRVWHAGCLSSKSPTARVSSSPNCPLNVWQEVSQKATSCVRCLTVQERRVSSPLRVAMDDHNIRC